MRSNNKLEDLLDSFTNGRERYETDALFRNCIMNLLNGASPVEILDQVLKSHADLSEKMKEVLKQAPPAPMRIELTSDNKDLLKELFNKE